MVMVVTVSDRGGGDDGDGDGGGDGDGDNIVLKWKLLAAVRHSVLLDKLTAHRCQNFTEPFPKRLNIRREKYLDQEAEPSLSAGM